MSLRCGLASLTAVNYRHSCACQIACACMVTGSVSSVKPAESSDDAVVLMRRYFDEVWNAGRLDVLDEIIDPAYINHSPSIPNPRPGPADLKPIVSEMR